MTIDQALLQQTLTPQEAERLVEKVLGKALQKADYVSSHSKEKPLTLETVREQILADTGLINLGVTAEMLEEVISSGEYRATADMDLSDLADAVVKAREGHEKLMKRYLKARKRKAKEIVEEYLKGSAREILKNDLCGIDVKVDGGDYFFRKATLSQKNKKLHSYFTYSVPSMQTHFFHFYARPSKPFFLIHVTEDLKRIFQNRFLLGTAYGLALKFTILKNQKNS